MALVVSILGILDLPRLHSILARLLAAQLQTRTSFLRPIIVINDPTSEGGQVIEGSPSTFINDLAVARLGDRVSCAHGECTIVSGDETLQVDNRAVAREGDSTACGATLVATQKDTGVL